MTTRQAHRPASRAPRPPSGQAARPPGHPALARMARMLSVLGPELGRSVHVVPAVVPSRTGHRTGQHSAGPRRRLTADQDRPASPGLACPGCRRLPCKCGPFGVCRLPSPRLSLSRPPGLLQTCRVSAEPLLHRRPRIFFPRRAATTASLHHTHPSNASRPHALHHSAASPPSTHHPLSFSDGATSQTSIIFISFSRRGRGGRLAA